MGQSSGASDYGFPVVGGAQSFNNRHLAQFWQASSRLQWVRGLLGDSAALLLGFPLGTGFLAEGSTTVFPQGHSHDFYLGHGGLGDSLRPRREI